MSSSIVRGDQGRSGKRGMGWWLVKRAALCSLEGEAVLKMLDDGKRQGTRDPPPFLFQYRVTRDT